MKNQKVIAGIVAVLVLLGVGVGVYSTTRKPAEVVEETTKKKKTVRNYNVIDVDERPYVKIVPVDARNISIVVDTLKKPAATVDYELEYQTGTLVQGAFGQIELTSVPATEKILLGSCSAGGSCTYHEDIKGGELRAFFEGSETFDLKSDWKYIENDGETAFTSKDAFFQIESKDLASANLLVIYNSPGYPGELEGTLASEIYSLTSNRLLSGSAELTIRAKQEGTLTIMGWDGSKWQQFETTTDGKAATATVELMEAYVVVTE